MKLVSMKEGVAGQDPATETIFLSQRHASFLSKMSGEINPEMPKAFGWPHAIRTILDRIDAVGGDVFRRRPQLAGRDWLTVGCRALVPGRFSAPAPA